MRKYTAIIICLIPVIFFAAYGGKMRLGEYSEYERWGLRNLENGKMEIPLQYDDTGFFRQGLVCCKQDGLWSYVDRRAAG